MSRLNGQSTKGDWKVYVTDLVPANTGTLNAWSLIVTPAHFDVQVFYDIVLRDDSSGNLLLINIATGDYLFCYSGGTITGRGTVTAHGSVYSLQHFATDRRVLATVETAVNRGVASLQVFALGKTFTIVDRNIKDNPSGCAP